MQMSAGSNRRNDLSRSVASCGDSVGSAEVNKLRTDGLNKCEKHKKVLRITT
jgi:hypothetical protein